jgi:hypothetical protein
MTITPEQRHVLELLTAASVATHRATASAKDATGQVSFVSSRLTLRLWPTVFAMTPDDAMALSIELQKAAIDARQNEHRTTLPQGAPGREEVEHRPTND